MKAKRIVAVVLVIVAGAVTHAGADLILPYDGTINTADPAFSITNTGSGLAIRGLATNTGDLINYGGYFEAYGKQGRGVTGATNGSDGWGVYGYATGNNGMGIYGESTYGIGVKGFTTSDNAWVPAIYGRSEGAGDGVYGWSQNRHGVFGVSYSPNHAGIYGVNNGGGYAAHFDGTIKTDVLEITGGADLSEQFKVNATDAKSSTSPGMVVSIDPENPGDLVISKKAYDHRVAGIISGAGGVRPGMLMRQEGSKADGASPVALTGRVYCWADASRCPIEPGDLLTTSDVPGHAMKVTDYAKAQGAVLGKAMTSLIQGRGLILVLACLQ